MFLQRWIASPLGPLQLVATDLALVAVYFKNHKGPAPYKTAREPGSGTHAVLDLAERELGEYFNGARCTFSVPLSPAGSLFQTRVWNALQAIPFGETATYSDIAQVLRTPGAARAVGAANGRNPLSIVVPCHRVIGSMGALVGYAGGLERKRWLLAHEGGKPLRPLCDDTHVA